MTEESNVDRVAVVIPTRNRPDKLGRCLTAIERARATLAVPVYVCDASDTAAVRLAVRTVCDRFSWVRLRPHDGKNVAAARNACARTAAAELLINIDDDIYVEPAALRILVDAYEAGTEPQVVAGSVAWGEDWSTPVVMRPIGYGRRAREGETPSFLVGAFFIYPRSFALTWPWNERIRTSDDRFMGAVWRSKGIRLGYAPSARAFHDHQHVSYDVEEQESHFYANLFDALIANPSWSRALSYELLGFAAGAKKYFRESATAAAYLRAWTRAHIALARDWRHLRSYVRRPLPPLP